MSFHYHARKVRNPNLSMWVRWSALHSCLRHVAGKGEFERTRQQWVEKWGIGEGRPPQDYELFQALSTLEIERNLWLERLRVFECKRIRAKARGKRQPSRAEWNALFEDRTCVV